jgi:hypothetical protein
MTETEYIASLVLLVEKEILDPQEAKDLLYVHCPSFRPVKEA